MSMRLHICLIVHCYCVFVYVKLNHKEYNDANRLFYIHDI